MAHRVLLIAEAANPEWVSVPLVGWPHALALSQVSETHLVTQVRNRAAILRFGWQEGREFTAINSESVARTANQVGNFLRGGKGKGWTTATAMKIPGELYFEHLVWRQFKRQLEEGQYDLVHRLTPLSPTSPSFLATKLRRISVPHVIGPLNGGVPWPREFDAERRAEKEWLSYVRGAYRLLPGQRAMRRDASAILCGSSETYAEFEGTSGDRLIYMPENAVDPQRFSALLSDEPVQVPSGPLRVAFVGRLVPYKGADMLLDAASALVRQGEVTLDIIGDGPERPALERKARELGMDHGVEFSGWLDHAAVQPRLKRASVLGFPSIREFGGGVVLEAMALGLAPLIVAYGGPKELVTKSSGRSVPIGSRSQIIEGFREQLGQLTRDRDLVARLGTAARQRVRRHFTWGKKAEHSLEVYDWVLGRGPKPDHGMPLAD